MSATALFHLAIDTALTNKVGVLYERAITGEPVDPNEHIAARINALTPEAKAQLAIEWKAAGLGKPSQGELTIDDYARADELLAAVEPFPNGEHHAPTRWPTPAETKKLQTELDELPPDLRLRIADAGGPVWRRWENGNPTADDVEDIARLVGGVSEEAVTRLEDITALVMSVHELDQPLPALILSHASDRFIDWTADHLTMVGLLYRAAEGGDVVVRDGRLAPSVQSIEAFAGAKREATTKAKAHAAELGRPKPSKWADVCADPILYAALVTEVAA